MVQETGGRGLNALTARLGSYKPGNASRDFYRNVPMPLERAVGGWRLVRTDNSTYIYIYIDITMEDTSSLNFKSEFDHTKKTRHRFM